MKKKITAIILAAGKSERFEGNKILQKINDRTFIEIILEKLKKIGLKPIVIYYYDEILNHIGNDILAIRNDNPESGQLSSIQLGLKEILKHDGFILWPGDMPLIQIETVKKMVDLANKHSDRVISPTYNGSIGHPTYFPKNTFSKLLSDLPNGAKSLVHNDRTITYEVTDRFTKIGVNTKKQLRSYIDEYNRYLKESSKKS